MEILVWFKRKYPELVKDMQNCSHDFSLEHQSNYHAEGDVYTHTLMVYTLLQGKNIELRLAGLLHDIGKPYTRREKIVGDRHYCSFNDHENLSTFLAIDILIAFEKDFNITVDKAKILKAINWHQKLHKLGSVAEGRYFAMTPEELSYLDVTFGRELDLYEMLTELGRADTLGRICSDYNELAIRYDFLTDFIPTELYMSFENKPHAVVLAGLPTSGKSTYAESLMKKDDYVYLSTDAIIMEKSKGREYRMMWDEKALEAAEFEMFDRLKNAIKNRKNIIVDRLNITEKMRRQISNIIPDKHYKKESVSFLIGESELLKRNAARKSIGKYIDDKIILGKAKAFELPGGDMFHINSIIC